MAVMIVGGGVGGMSLALALARRGLASVVIEQAATVEPVGAGIQLGPNATRVLRGWGLGEALDRAAVAPITAEVRDAATGRVLVANRLGPAAQARWGGVYLTLTRAALQGLLLEAVQASGEVELRLGCQVVSATSADGQARAKLSNGETLSGPLLIGCDGLHSVIQGAVATAAPPRFTRQTAWRGLARMEIDGEPRVQVWTGPSRHFVRYPVAEGLVNMVGVFEARAKDTESWTAEGQGADLAAAFADWPEPVRATIAAVDRPWRSALYDRAPLTRWSRGRISLLGDAAHPMLPFLAQGAAMAIEDAEVLATLLGDSADVEAALAAYETARRPRTAKVQAWASRNATLFHLPSPLATGVFAAARGFDRLRGAEPEARFDWLYGWAP
jgi:salicylate hydroxylase